MELKTYNFTPGFYGGFARSTTISTMEPGLSEYVFEAWERMTEGGLVLDPDAKYWAAVPCGRGRDGHAMAWALYASR